MADSPITMVAQPKPVKERDPAAEAVLGLANGVVVGGALAALGSAAVTLVARKAGAGTSATAEVFANMKSSHLGAVGGATAGVGFVNGVVRFAQAEPYNRWARAHNAGLVEAAHTARLDAEPAATGRQV